jgi:hypothetical protein
LYSSVWIQWVLFPWQDQPAVLLWPVSSSMVHVCSQACVRSVERNSARHLLGFHLVEWLDWKFRCTSGTIGGYSERIDAGAQNVLSGEHALRPLVHHPAGVWQHGHARTGWRRDDRTHVGLTCSGGRMFECITCLIARVT